MVGGWCVIKSLSLFTVPLKEDLYSDDDALGGLSPYCLSLTTKT